MTVDRMKRVWITGASSGIGRAAALELARVGVEVVASARRGDELERLGNEVDNTHAKIIPAVCNIASAQNVDQTFKKFFPGGNIDAVINAAGITSFKEAKDNSIPEILDIINTNLLGAIYVMKTVLPALLERESGTIMNIESAVVTKVFTNSSAYSASKSGLLAYTRVLREELRNKNIRVIDIIPGATETPIWNSKVREKHGDKMMRPEAIARVITSALLEKTNLVSEEIVLRPVTGDL